MLPHATLITTLSVMTPPINWLWAGGPLPIFVEGVALTLDYYDIEVEHVVNKPDPSTVINNCYTGVGLSSPDCARIDRNAQLKSWFRVKRCASRTYIPSFSLRHNHRRTGKIPRSQILQRLVGLLQRVNMHFRLHRYTGRQRQE